MADSDTLGSLIRSTRLDKGLSLGQLASAVGRSSSTVRRWERGQSTPSSESLAAVATALDLDVESLAATAAAAHPPADEQGQDASEAVAMAVLDGAEPAAVIPRVRTTIEDAEVVGEVADYFETPSPAIEAAAQPQVSRYGKVSSAIWGRRDSWIGWVRGFLTALALLFLFMGLMWALGELLAALKDVLGSFSTGA